MRENAKKSASRLQKRFRKYNEFYGSPFRQNLLSACLNDNRYKTHTKQHMPLKRSRITQDKDIQNAGATPFPHGLMEWLEAVVELANAASYH